MFLPPEKTKLEKFNDILCYSISFKKNEAVSKALCGLREILSVTLW
jgi:hypothetical protein